jgi:ferredoxin-NADP reductase
MYSLCGPRDAGYYRIAVKREKGGAGSNYLHDHVRTGDTIDLGAPRGSFTLAHDSGPVALLSAGVGITPVLAMLWELAARPTPRAVWWIYSTQNKEHHSFCQEVATAGAKIPGFRSLVIYSRPGETDRKGVDYDHAGHLSLETLKQLDVPNTVECYICGPTAYLTDTLAFLKAAGVPEPQIRYEAFGTQNLAPAAKIPHLPNENDGTGPMITFIKSNLSFRWQTKFANLLEAAEACDVNVKWSCRSGVCHRCESNLLSGDIHYSPEPLDPAAQGNILICCAKPVTDVQIDL